ncbi:hypothetical protein DPMN_108840 [Dreissena polymorpha]|uniref:Uncharacterized protein n=1 Tax=Dreissena polymorpha TaxID=45954 RepID=A0A9D4K9N5_DREPO|nr:hypothetical protein DPMN_108840 [Dreissena polymorpha]
MRLFSVIFLNILNRVRISIGVMEVLLMILFGLLGLALGEDQYEEYECDSAANASVGYVLLITCLLVHLALTFRQERAF